MLVTAALGIVAILALSAFFSGSETALMALDRFRLRHLGRTDPKATQVLEITTHPERVLGTILTGNVFVNTAAGALVTYAVTRLVTQEEEQGRMISLATLLLTALILVFGEMVPKSLAARRPLPWALSVVRPISLLIRLLGPAVRLLTAVSNAFLSLFGVSPTGLEATLTLEEIKALLYASGSPEEEPGGRRRMLQKVIELGERRVKEVMVPRTEMVAVEKTMPLEEIVRLIQNKRFSRMPVYQDKLDNIVGILFAKDVLTYWGARIPFRLEQVLRKPYFVPDTANVEQALEQLQHERTHLAIVVDEHGGVEGLVTLEDLLEEIVGELFDEKDEHQAAQVLELPDGSLLLDGLVPVKELNERLGLQIPENSEDFHTLAGFILHELGHIPVAGEELIVDGTLLSVEKVVGHRVLRVRARKRKG